MNNWHQIGVVPAPMDQYALFWLVAKTEEESYRDTDGNPIVALSYKPHIELTKPGHWSSLVKATHWMPLPEGPTLETPALCPHGMPLAENTCGPCSEGRPNVKAEQQTAGAVYPAHRPRNQSEGSPAAEAVADETAGRSCPTCRSPEPHRHPTNDFGEPSQSCKDEWHRLNR